MTVVVMPVGIVIAPRMLMALRVAPIALVADGSRAPLVMAAFPIMNTDGHG